MEFMYEDERLAVSVIQAIHTGDIPSLQQLLAEHPGLAKIRILERKPDNIDSDSSTSRTLLHVVTDWPGHFPHGADTVRVLTKFGADVNAPFVGPHIETPLHWAASSNDVQVLDALLDAGADIEAPGDWKGKVRHLCGLFLSCVNNETFSARNRFSKGRLALSLLRLLGRKASAYAAHVRLPSRSWFGAQAS
ncbi:ankyrin repeat domain-containing protein [Paenibacillus sp. FSL K6-0108]|uniref:ankyrin repeat domain-containing protein n=1 Tax=Paenibacillus sp. FSL K6-0108 TaxID=2921417 RepID=UPI0032476ED1